MWTHKESINVATTPAQIWKLFSDVAGWKKWNSGIEQIEIHGAFAKGTTFSMKPPGEDAFTSTLVEVKENESFTDETVIEETRVLVHHTIEPLAFDHARVIYSIEITGPAAADVGPIVTADFPEVLVALKNLAERSTQP